MTYKGENRPMLTDKELTIGLADLQVRGMVEYKGEDGIRLTEAGVDRSLDIWFSLSPADRIAMVILMDDMRTVAREEGHGS